MREKGHHIAKALQSVLHWFGLILLTCWVLRANTAAKQRNLFQAPTAASAPTTTLSKDEQSRAIAEETDDLFQVDWFQPDTETKPPWISETLAVLIPLALLIYIPIQSLRSVQVSGTPIQDALGHAIKGLPILVTAVGATTVAVALLLRSTEEAKEVKKKIAEDKLADLEQWRPTIRKQEATVASAATAIHLIEWQNLIETQAKAVRKAKKSLSRARRSARKLEPTGTFILVAGAILAAMAWHSGL